MITSGTFYDSSMNLLSNDVFTRSEVGTGWKYWFHFGLKIGIKDFFASDESDIEDSDDE